MSGSRVFKVLPPVCVALALLAGLGHVAGGQKVSGVVRGDRDGVPIPGAIVILVGAANEKLAATMSRDDGAYRLVAPSSGRYGLRLDIVGFRSLVVPPFEVSASTTAVVRDLRFSFERVALPTVAVTASSSCDRLAGEVGDAARLWSEARKILEATKIAQDERRFSVALTRFERELALPDSAVTSSRSFTQSGVSENPFVSLSPDSIAQHGYRVGVGGRDLYYGPDARVLLSDAFVSGHCFGTRRSGPTGSLGLSFRPLRSTGRIDVEGVLWLDSASAELRRLDYLYVPTLGRDGRGGGTIDFGKLPSGLWGVKKWTIRMPVLEVRQSNRRPDGALGRFVDTVVTAVHEEGGEVLAGLGAVAPPIGTRVRGVVFDSSRNVPLSGAVVTLEGVGRNTRTDADGTFVLDSLGDAGTYHIRFWHPRLDSLGLAMPRMPIRVQRGQETAARLAIPGTGRIATERCGATSAEPGRVVTGMVRRSGSNRTVSGADVFVLERQPQQGADGPSEAAPSLRRLTTVSSESGRYAVCQLWPGSLAWLVARADGRWSRPVALADSDWAAALDISLPFTAGPESVDTSASTRTAPLVELGRTRIPPNTAIVEGWVVFSDEPPSAPVQVLVDGQVVSASVPPGLFHVEHVGEGVRQIGFRMAGAAVVTAAVNVRRGEASLLLATLERSAAPVAAVIVPSARPESWREGFNERRKRGQGSFFDRAQIERRGARTLADVLRGTQGVKIVTDGAGYRYQSTHRRDPTVLTKDGVVTPAGSLGACDMMIYVDGQPVVVHTGGVDAQVPMDQVAAIEVFPGATSVPRQFAGPQAACGVILIWTGG